MPRPNPSHAVREQESDQLFELVYDRLTVLWREVELFGRVTRLSSEDREKIATDALGQFLVDMMHGSGMSLREAKSAIEEYWESAEQAREGTREPNGGGEEERQAED